MTTEREPQGPYRPPEPRLYSEWLAVEPAEPADEARHYFQAQYGHEPREVFQIGPRLFLGPIRERLACG